MKHSHQIIFVMLRIIHSPAVFHGTATHSTEPLVWWSSLGCSVIYINFILMNIHKFFLTGHNFHPKISVNITKPISTSLLILLTFDHEKLLEKTVKVVDPGSEVELLLTVMREPVQLQRCAIVFGACSCCALLTIVFRGVYLLFLQPFYDLI